MSTSSTPVVQFLNRLGFDLRVASSIVGSTQCLQEGNFLKIRTSTKGHKSLLISRRPLAQKIRAFKTKLVTILLAVSHQFASPKILNVFKCLNLKAEGQRLSENT